MGIPWNRRATQEAPGMEPPPSHLSIVRRGPGAFGRRPRRSSLTSRLGMRAPRSLPALRNRPAVFVNTKRTDH